MQLDFFDIGTPVMKETEKISWSPSKIGTQKQCSWKYYCQYYGSKQTKAKSDENKSRLQYLAGLSNKSLVAGEIIHSVVAAYFRKGKQNEIWSADRLVNFALSILRAAIQYSKDERAGKHKIFTYPPPILKEIYYGSIDEKALYQEIADRLQTSLKNFHQSELFAHLRMNGIKADAIIEGKCIYTLPEHIKVDGVIDLAFHDQGKFWITDWKTGKVEEEETSLQLLSYALWATRQKGIPKEAVNIQKAYLLDNRLEPLEYSEEQLGRAKVRIMQDVEILRELDEFGIEGRHEAFTKCKQPRICNLCPFQEVCDKSN